MPFDAVLPSLIQIPIVAAFIWYSLQTQTQYRESVEHLQTAQAESLHELAEKIAALTGQIAELTAQLAEQQAVNRLRLPIERQGGPYPPFGGQVGPGGPYSGQKATP